MPTSSEKRFCKYARGSQSRIQSATGDGLDLAGRIPYKGRAIRDRVSPVPLFRSLGFVTRGC